MKLSYNFKVIGQSNFVAILNKVIMKGTLPVGIRMIIGFYILIFVSWSIGRGGSLIIFDFLIKEDSLLVVNDSIDPVLIAIAKGSGLSGILILQPLLIVSAIGLAKQKFYGMISSWMVLALLIYWPTFWLSNNYYTRLMTINYRPIGIVTLLCTCLIIGFSLWSICYLFFYAKDKYMLGMKT